MENLGPAKKVSPQEMAKAEGMMSEKQKEASEIREEGYEIGEKENVEAISKSERVRSILLDKLNEEYNKIENDQVSLAIKLALKKAIGIITGAGIGAMVTMGMVMFISGLLTGGFTTVAFAVSTGIGAVGGGVIGAAEVGSIRDTQLKKDYASKKSSYREQISALES